MSNDIKTSPVREVEGHIENTKDDALLLLNTKIGAKTRSIRIKKGLTLKEVELLMKSSGWLLSYNRLSMLERGAYNWNSSHLCAISSALDVSVDELVVNNDKSIRNDDEYQIVESWRSGRILGLIKWISSRMESDSEMIKSEYEKNILSAWRKGSGVGLMGWLSGWFKKNEG